MERRRQRRDEMAGRRARRGKERERAAEAAKRR